jgi:amino acid adenylation domain-containing protein
VFAEQKQPKKSLKENNTVIKFPQNCYVSQLFEQQITKTPNAIAVQINDQYITYTELNQRANQLAHYLRERGVSSEILVGISIERSLDAIVALLATLKAGGAYVPLDPNYPKERLNYILEDAQISIILTQKKGIGDFSKTKANVIYLESDWQKIRLCSQKNLADRVKGEDLAYIIYTSGSTGKPKGVMISHQALSNFIQSIIAEFAFAGRGKIDKTSHDTLQKHNSQTKSDRVLQFASINFDAAIEEIYPCLCAGGTLVLRTDAMLASPQEFMTTCDRLQITILDLPTAYWHQLTAELVASNLALPESLRLVVIGGEKASPDLIRAWQKRINQLGRGENLQLVNTYGPTEATVSATLYRVPIHPPHQIPIGRPLPEVLAYILDENLQPVPTGEIGELYIGGNNLSRGYFNKPELTLQKFICDPFSDSPEARIYKTGDLARFLPDGNIEFMGRIDHQVKIRGFRIELGEIETTLARHPAVREVVTVAQEYKAGDKRLIAYIVPQSGRSPTNKELRNFLSGKLPDYMMPSSFVLLERFPLTPNNKINISALPKPDKNNLNLDEEFIEANNDIERRLTSIWEKIFKIQPIGIKDDFFSLGGNSLLALSLVAEITKAFNQNFSPAILFETPTIEKLATLLAQINDSAYSSVVKIKTSGSKPPLFIIANDSFLYKYMVRYLDDEQPVYIIQEPLENAQEMAVRCLKQICFIQPEGPYHLLGHSYEGLVAYEIAQKLSSTNQKVDFLGLIDTPTPEVEKSLEKRSRLDRINRRLKKIYSLSLNEKIEFIKDRLQYRINEAFTPIIPLIDRFTGEYLPQFYRGKLTIFAANFELYALENSKFGWDNFVTGEIEICRVPGTHRSMLLNKKNAELIAKKIHTYLQD